MCYQEKPTLKDFQKIRTNGVNWGSSKNRYSENVDWFVNGDFLKTNIVKVKC